MRLQLNSSRLLTFSFSTILHGFFFALWNVKCRYSSLSFHHQNAMNVISVPSLGLNAYSTNLRCDCCCCCCRYSCFCCCYCIVPVVYIQWPFMCVTFVNLFSLINCLWICHSETCAHWNWCVGMIISLKRNIAKFANNQKATTQSNNNNSCYESTTTKLLDENSFIEKNFPRHQSIYLDFLDILKWWNGL